MKRGVPPTARKARTGELTPPGITLQARSKRLDDVADRSFMRGPYTLFVAPGLWRRFFLISGLAALAGRARVGGERLAEAIQKSGDRCRPQVGSQRPHAFHGGVG